MHDDIKKDRYCSKCGYSLVRLDSYCTSKNCDTCGNEIFFINRGINGGIKIEEGNKFYLPPDGIPYSLDPKKGTIFTKDGLFHFLQEILINSEIIKSKDEVINKLKSVEINIDKDLKKVECIQHCDLETADGVNEAINIFWIKINFMTGNSDCSNQY